MDKSRLILLLCIVVALASCLPEQSANDKQLPDKTNLETVTTVKKSSSGICHDKSSGSFNRTKNFTSYKTMDLCIASGGRAYKGFESSIDIAEQDAIDENRSFVSLYNRDDWEHWIDSDKDCQNTRHELLIATSSIPVKFKSDRECNVLSGSWYDPYSGETFTNSTDLELDHVVPLKFAHGHGADKWSKEKKKTFANDTENLLLVSASLNSQKGAKGIDEWLPPNHQYRCAYITHFNSVMNKYDLDYIPSEKRIVDKMIKACNKD
jgi:hypothetical protein